MTNEEKYKEVCRLVRETTMPSIKAACKELGLTEAMYQYYRMKHAGQKKKKTRMPQPVIQTVRIEEPIQQEEEVSIVIMKGKKSTVEGITRNLAAIFGGRQ